MLKYKVGQRVIDYWERHGLVQSIDISGAVTYCVVRLDSGETYRYFEHQLRTETSQQAENERLKAIAVQVRDLLEGALEDYSDSVPEEADYESGQVNAYERVLALFSEGETK